MLGWLRRWPGRARASAVALGVVGIIALAIAILPGSDSAAAGQETASSVTSTSMRPAGSGTTSNETAAIEEPLAVLRVVHDGVAVQPAAGDFGAAADGQPLTEGITIRTDASGRAAIEYFDGSVTRLDGDTTLQITTLQVLDNAARSKVIVALQSTGSTYSRVVPLTDPESRFDVMTLSAATSVVGTRYFVRIDPITGSTTVVVVEGTVTVTDPADPSSEIAISAGSSFEFGPDGVHGVEDAVAEDLLGSDWVEFNCDQDVVAFGGSCDGGDGSTTTTSSPTSTTVAPSTTSSATTSSSTTSTTAGGSTTSTSSSTTSTTSTTVGATTTTSAAASTTSTSTSTSTSTTVGASTTTTTVPNRAPDVVTPDDRSSAEADCVSLAVSGSDPDDDGITWSATGLPDGLTIDAGTGVISGTLSYTSAGVHTVTVTATDDGSPEEATEVTFTWTVTETNEAPQTDGPYEGSTDEDTPLTLTLSASDGDNACDELTITITTLPGHGTLSADDGASFLGVGSTVAVGDDCSVSLRYDPQQNFNGADEFQFTVGDTLLDGVGGQAEESAAATFAITVDPVNDAPFTTDENLTARYFTTPMNNIDAVTFVLSGGDVDDADSDLVAYVTINPDPTTTLGTFYQYCDGCPSPTPVATSGPDAGRVTDPGHRVQWYTLTAPPTGVAPVDLTETLSYTLRDPSGAVSNTKTIVATVHFAVLVDDSEDPPPDPGDTTTTTLTGDTSAPTSGGGRGR